MADLREQACSRIAPSACRTVRDVASTAGRPAPLSGYDLHA